MELDDASFRDVDGVWIKGKAIFADINGDGT
jgi:hypothetical protein